MCFICILSERLISEATRVFAFQHSCLILCETVPTLKVVDTFLIKPTVTHFSE
jgi:hypothetical protein